MIFGPQQTMPCYEFLANKNVSWLLLSWKLAAAHLLVRFAFARAAFEQRKVHTVMAQQGDRVTRFSHCPNRAEWRCWPILSQIQIDNGPLLTSLWAPLTAPKRHLKWLLCHGLVRVCTYACSRSAVSMRPIFLCVPAEQRTHWCIEICLRAALDQFYYISNARHLEWPFSLSTVEIEFPLQRDNQPHFCLLIVLNKHLEHCKRNYGAWNKLNWHLLYRMLFVFVVWIYLFCCNKIHQALSGFELMRYLTRACLITFGSQEDKFIIFYFPISFRCYTQFVLKEIQMDEIKHQILTGFWVIHFSHIFAQSGSPCFQKCISRVHQHNIIHFHSSTKPARRNLSCAAPLKWKLNLIWSIQRALSRLIIYHFEVLSHSYNLCEWNLNSYSMHTWSINLDLH